MANEAQDFQLDLTDLATWDEHSGGGPVYLGKIGNAKAIIKHARPMAASAKGNLNGLVEVALSEPGFEGVVVGGVKPFAGTNSKKPLAYNVGDILCSVGFTKEQINGYAQYGRQMTFSQLLGGLVGRECYVTIETRTDNRGELKSGIGNFISKARYEESPGLRDDVPQPSRAVTGAVGAIGGAAAMGLPGVPELPSVGARSSTPVAASLGAPALPGAPGNAAAPAAAAADNPLMAMLAGAKVG